ncbi:hypothetical protein C8J56DRAFT_1102896 [Mycena floridula]|nr:hypothetical protein C8J56DRAFT_1102896 [Mycena floridula]
MSSHLPKARSAEILATPKRTFQYGETLRHQLDIYYPSKTAGAKTPVLFFVYGGGWVSGERILAAPNDLVYANVGYYFAQHGFITIIPDYRLVPGLKMFAMLCNGSSITQLNWFSAVSHPQITILSSSSLILLAPISLRPSLHHQSSILRICIRESYRYIAGAAPDNLFVMHWGSLKESFKKDSVALMSQVAVERLPPLFCIEAESDTDGMKEIGKTLVDNLTARPGIKVTTASAKGHNHVSLNWALGTGEGEEWAEQAVQFMKKGL